MGKSKHVHIDLSKRQVIENMLSLDKSATEIARVLNVHKSTISREVFKYRTLFFVGDKVTAISMRIIKRHTKHKVCLSGGTSMSQKSITITKVNILFKPSGA